MRTRRSEPDRQDVVARRLALLSPVPVGEQPRPPLSLVRGSDARRAGARIEEDPEPTDPSAHLDHAVAPARTGGWQDDLHPVGASGPHWSDEHTRVRPRLPVPPLPPAPPEPLRPPEPAAGFEIPVPGRHASRRTLGGLPPSIRLGTAHLAVLAVVVAIGLAVTSWWVVRSEPVPVAAPARDSPLADPTLLSLPTDTADSPGGPAGTDEADGTVVVDVAGEVRRPGVLELPAGSRVVDAIEAAGGARPGVDLRGLNLARVLVDGEQVLVGKAAAVASGAAPPAGAPAPAPGALVDLNTADMATLEGLPEIGPVTAQAILTWREEHGGFTAVQELLEVDGIGPATLETVAPLVTV